MSRSPFLLSLSLVAGLVALAAEPAYGRSTWERNDAGECVRVWSAAELGRGPIAMTNGILLPIREAVGGSADGVHVQTRSAWDVLRVFGAGIEVPSSHLAAGIVEPVAWAMAPEKRVITIRSSEKRPDDATVRIRFRDRWFYVDATDTDSKRAFMFLRTFVGIRLADPGAAQQAPVLTVPVN